MTGVAAVAVTESTTATGEVRRDVLARRFALSVDVPRRFFAVHAENISQACLEMARRFERGGRLLVFGEGAQASDAEHVAVEFVHPVLVGKRALPAIALAGDSATLVPRLEALAQPSDIGMAICIDGQSPALQAALSFARSAGLMTVVLTGTAGRIAFERTADHLFAVDSSDPLVIQETHETCYHVLWELVHLFFDHRSAP